MNNSSFLLVELLLCIIIFFIQKSNPLLGKLVEGKGKIYKEAYTF